MDFSTKAAKFSGLLTCLWTLCSVEREIDFEADAQHGTAAVGGKLEHPVVVGEFRGHAGLPLEAASLQCAHDLLRPLRRPEEIRVIDRNNARAAVLHLVDHFIDGAIAEFQAVHQRLGAESAALVAAPRSLDEGAVHIAVLLQKIVARHRHSNHRMQRVGFVGSAHRSRSEIVEQSIDHKLDFADNDGVAVLKRFLRHEARMHAAHDDGHALGAESVGDFVAAVDVTRHRRNPNQIGFQIEVDVLDVFVGQDTSYWSRGIDAATASSPASGEYSARFK